MTSRRKTSEPEQPEAAPAAPEDWLGQGLLLVADDEEIVCLVAARLLESLGFEVVQAHDGRECLDQLARLHPQVRLVLLDLSMPNLDGEQTFRELHRLYPGLPVLLMSGYGEQELRERLAGQGFAGFLQKPFCRADMAQKVKAILG